MEDAGGALTATEVQELTRVFPPGPSAVGLLRRAGFPAAPAAPAASDPPAPGPAAGAFWSAVARTVAGGEVADGRLRLLAAALRTYPHNEVFRAAVPEPCAGGVRRVLVAGAVPEGRELSEIQRAARGALTVDWCPAAAATDLRRVLTVRPDVLHLVCRREDSALVFEDTHGAPYRTPVTRVAELLAAYRRLTGARLRGVVLGCSDGAALAPLFAGAAEVVVAHHGPLSAAHAAAFAADLYGLLRTVPALPDAARRAAERTRATRLALTTAPA
ncbi:effector-associated domain EAD1-containing protein [Streptomyces sp. NPDC048636]|uniref:effector-associated domain EAD1-containing protein n=1 Tax=Streptomyces sp. NPDC048636 TaxID=3155762 RepID=UPI0034141921